MTKIVTANDLKTGVALYLSETMGWTPRVNEAAVSKTPEEEAALLEKAKKDEHENLVINPALIEVRLEGQKIVPVQWKELIRSRGPTVRTDLGYQADETET